MIECLIYTHTLNPMLLLVFGLLLDLTCGLLLAAGVLGIIGYLDAKHTSQTEQQRKLDHQRREDEALARTQSEDEINTAQDAAMICFLCWETRHPGLDWPRAWGPDTSVCGSHYTRQLLNKMILANHNIILYQNNDEKSKRDYALAG